MDDDLPPPDPVGERCVVEIHAADGPDLRGEVELDPRQLQPALAGRVGDRSARQERERDRISVDHQAKSARDLRALAGEHRPRRKAALLEGRDLRLVQDVVDVDAIARDPHAVEVVDREVAERMGARGGREDRDQRQRQGGAH